MCAAAGLVTARIGADGLWSDIGRRHTIRRVLLLIPLTLAGSVAAQPLSLRVFGSEYANFAEQVRSGNGPADGFPVRVGPFTYSDYCDGYSSGVVLIFNRGDAFHQMPAVSIKADGQVTMTSLDENFNFDC